MRADRWIPFAKLAGAYVAAALLGTSWATVADIVSPVWPAAGVGLAALVLGGLRLWPALFAGAFVSSLLTIDADAAVCAFLAAGTTAAFTLAAFFLRRPPRFDPDHCTLSAMTRLILIGAVAAPAATATIGIAGLHWAGIVQPQTLVEAWVTWGFGDAAGVLVLTPLLLCWARPSPVQQTRKWRLQLSACLAVSLLFALLTITDAAPSYLRPYHVYPLLVWAGLALRIRGATIILLVIAAAALATTILGGASFEPLLVATAIRTALLEQFIIISAVTTLLLATVADERRADAALRKARDRLDYTLRSAGMIAWEWDPETRAVTYRGDIFAFFGRDLRNGSEFSALIHPDDRARVRDAIDRSVASGDEYNLEYRIVRPDGETRWVFDRGRMTRTADGKPLMSGVNSDITERKAIEDALREREERLRMSQEAANIGSWEYRVRERRLLWSPQLFRLHGRDPTLGEPSIEEWFDIVHPDDREPAAAAFAAAEVGSSYEYEFRIVLPDGSIRWLRAQARVDGDEQGQPLRHIGINMDVTERKRDEERQQLLMAELDHRVKNILATIQALIARTAASKGSVEELARTLQGRVQAMARAHSMLARNRWESASLRSLLEDELKPYGEERVRLSGPDVALVPRAALSLSLALHELTTNAAKYGALSSPNGQVQVDWSISDGAKPELCLDWIESGGPLLSGPPARQGFGSLMTERVIRHEFGGQLTLTYTRLGLRGRIVLPYRMVARGGLAVREAQPVAQRTNGDTAELAGLHILVVEDSPIVAAQIEDDLAEAGLTVIGPFANLAPAIEAATSRRIDAAVLDVNLYGDFVFPLAELLAARGVPFVLATGYGDPAVLPPSLRNRPKLLKPYDRHQLLRAIADLGVAPTTERRPDGSDARAAGRW